MKLKYEVEQQTNRQPQVLMDKVISILSEQDYLIDESTLNTVLFRDNIWSIRSKSKIFSKVDRGKFEFVASDGICIVKYTYYISFLPEFLIVLGVLLIGGIFQNYYAIIVLVPLLTQLIFRINRLKEEAGEMIERIVN